MTGFHFSDDQSEPNAAVVCIKNKSKDGEVAYLHDVRAALIFRDDKGQEMGEGVHQACWVNNHLKNASFDLEETKCVILAAHHNDKVIAPYIKEHMTSWGLGVSAEPYILGKAPSTVELILLCDGKRVIEPMTFAFVEEKNETNIRLVR
jgi:hypothetical protein